MPLILIASERFADHMTPPGHPESPERAEVTSPQALLSWLADKDLT